MSFHTFGPGLVLDQATMRGIPATVGRLEDAETGEIIQPYTMDPEPVETTVITNRYGYFPQFQVPDTVRRLRMTFGNMALEYSSWEHVVEVSERAVEAARDAEAAFYGRMIHPVHMNGPEYGVSDYTAEFNTFSNENPGEYETAWTYDSIQTLERLAVDGWKQVKLPFRWERVQPVLGGALDDDEAGRIAKFLDDAHAAGLGVILDVHNYGLYYQHDATANMGKRLSIGSAELPEHLFADLWERLAGRFAGHPALNAYLIMAEPQSSGGMTRTVWHSASQAAVDAIRTRDVTTQIQVPGFEWSSMQYWEYYNGPEWWIVDPANKSVAEVHHYWDADGSGEYANTYDYEVTQAENEYTPSVSGDALHVKTLSVLQSWVTWLERNGVDGVIGEAGWPDNSDLEQWNRLGQAYLDRCTSLGIPVVAWFAGEWAWHEDHLRLYEGGEPIGLARGQVKVWTSQTGGLRDVARGAIDHIDAGLETMRDYLDDLPTNFVTEDTSVGTRILLGDTQIYGDTGWRDITHLLSPGLVRSTSGNANRPPMLRRENRLVTIELYLDVMEPGITMLTAALPNGFRPTQTISRPGTLYVSTSRGSVLPGTVQGHYIARSGGGVNTGSALPNPGTVIFSASWLTSDAWPTINIGSLVE